MNKQEICVVHLVRAQNGIDPFRKFLASYGKNPAGVDHELVFVLKGFPGKTVDAEYEAQFESVKHRRLVVPDWGYDITAYFRTARVFQDHEFFCFLNSFSEILAADWLLKRHRTSLAEKAGVAGATGSSQGFHPDWKSIANREKFSLRSGWKRQLLEFPMVEELNEFVNRFLSPPFPNPHVRTNAFLLRRDVMLALRPQATLTKRRSYGFESGCHNMTHQIREMDKPAILVGKDGISYHVDDWDRSNIFWQTDQRNLLVADKQTRRYEMADPEIRKIISHYAWGKDHGAIRED